MSNLDSIIGQFKDHIRETFDSTETTATDKFDQLAAMLTSLAEVKTLAAARLRLVHNFAQRPDLREGIVHNEKVATAVSLLREADHPLTETAINCLQAISDLVDDEVDILPDISPESSRLEISIFHRFKEIRWIFHPAYEASWPYVEVRFLICTTSGIHSQYLYNANELIKQTRFALS